MSRSTAEIIADIEAFTPRDEEWLPLDGLLEELWSDGSPGNAIEALLSVFERFPGDDGNGVFWSVIHGLEDIGGYEPSLVDSIRRRPSFCGLIMVNRLINGGHSEIDGTSLIGLLQSVGNDETIEESLRNRANRFVQYQREKPT